MNSFNKVMDYIILRVSFNLLGVGLLLPVIFFSSASQAAESVCAVVKIEIQQEITLERQAFDAKMKINNNLAGVTLQDVGVSVLFKDENGDSVLASSDPNSTTAKFFIKIDAANLAVDSGTATVGPQSTLEAHWLIIPAPGASGDVPTGKLYSVGAVLTYTQGGEQKEITVAPDTIFVKPLPLLSIDYFLEENAYADDAFTPDVVEPSIPFTLGVRINNSGSAAASNFKIDSAQPTITENEQGLKIAFNIIGSSVNDQPATNSLLMNFGDIAPASSTVGRWDMVTTLSGTFTEFSAEFTHADELGGKLTSIIDPAGIKTHLLVHNVLVDLPGRDLVRDFLAIDGDVYRVYESSGVDGVDTGIDTVVDTVLKDGAAGTSLTVLDSGSEVRLSLTTPISAGFSYVSLSDPFAGTKVIKQMVRSDGRTIPLANAWTHKVRKANPAAGWDYFVNFFDVNSTGNYAVLMGVPDIGPVPPEFTPLLNQTTFETATLTFPVSATDANGDAVTLTAGTLPAGATFTSDTSGSGTFTWSPVGATGNYVINFTASDGTLTKQTSVNIKVNPSWDTDGDGMDDAWEIANFGNLDRDGTGDLDGDGLSDLQEYLNQTDPNLDPPLAPINLVALPGNAENTLSWDTVTGVDAYNIYWSLTADITPANGSLVEALSSPHVHTGLDNDVTYYYVVTSVGAGGESAASNIVSVTTGVRDWTAPKVFGNAAGTFGQNVDIAMTANGDAIAVWQQTNIDISIIMASRYVIGTGWSIPIAISNTILNATNPHVSMDEAGNAFAVWQQGDTTQSDILAARYDVISGNGWEAAVAIETDAVNAAIKPQIKMTKAGTAFVVWQQGSSIYTNRYESSIWQTESLLADETNFAISELKLAINESGEGFTTWTVTQDQAAFDLRLSQLSSNTWTTPISVATGLDNAINPAITINDSGNALLAWTAFDGTNHALMASGYTTTGGWTTAQTIGNAIGDAQSPQLVMDATGNAYVTWTQSSSPYSVYVRRYDATASWQTADIIEQRQRGNAANPQLSLDLRGNVVVTWQQDDGVQQNILAAVYDKGLSTWSAERVIETNNSGHATLPVIAMNDSGNAIVAWQQDNADELVISTNHFEAGNTGLPNINPIAVAGADQSVDEQSLVTLNGSDSFDQDGSGLISAYSWSQTAGTTVTLTNATTAAPTFAAPIVLATDGAQTLTFELTVTDDANATSTKTVNVIVNPVNAAPIADAGIDQTVNEQTTVTLTGSGTDTDGSVDTYSWTQISGETVTLTNANTATATFDAPVVTVQQGVQTFVFELTITDNEGATATSQVNVLVSPVNTIPVANAGVDLNVDEQTSVSLTGSGSDSDGVVVSYVWSQVSGLPVTFADVSLENTTFTAPTVLVQDGPKTLVLRLTVTDNEGATFSDDVSIIVNAVNALPIANAGLPQTVDEQTTVSLQATSFDSDGSVVSHQWTQTAGTLVTIINANTISASFVAPVVLVQDGTKTVSFTLTVTDNEGAVVTSLPVTFTVNPVNTKPTANAGVDQTIDEQTSVSLAGGGADTDGSVTTFQWTQTAGATVTLTNANTANASFTSPAVLVQDGAQTLTFRLTVTDNETATVFDDINVVVNPVNAIPVANAGADQNIDEQTAVTLSGTGTDTDGSITAYEWTQTSGATVTLTNANTENASFTAPIVLVQDGAQTLMFRLTVIDNETASVFDDINVVVNPVNAIPTTNAGSDQSVNEQAAVTLAGTATDSDGSITAHQWTQTAGVVVTLTNANSANASFTSPVVLVQDGAQTLTFRLTVTDNETATIFDDINVVVNPVNAIPTANAGNDQSVNEQTAVTLAGIAADSDVGGYISSYNWTQTSGATVGLTNANTANVSFTSPVVLVQDGAQTLTFRLTVIDNETATVFDDINVVVNPVNANPTANAGSDRAVNEQTPVTLAGSGTDTDGSITAYQWTQITGPTVTLTNSNTATPNFITPVVLVADSPTILTFRLTVTDNETAIAAADVTIGVMAVNASPVTNAGIDQVVNEQTSVTLTSAANDSDGSIATYQWTQVSGLPVTLVTASTATATFTSPVVLIQDRAQVLTFRNTVTDNEGGTHTDEMTVTVQPVNALPVANAGTNFRIAEYSTVTLSGSGTDSDGEITAYQWTQVSGLPVVITNINTATASFAAPPVYQDEVLSFNLVVTDNETGVSTADSVSVTLFSVNPDDDADGLPDLYEIANFGTLTRDGTADFDNDGYSDLQEYQQATNPLAVTLAPPAGLKAVAANTQVTLSWNSVTDAVGYNVYWDTVPNVTKDSNVINNVTSGYVHTALTNGTPYYYVVTALSSGDESVVSNEVSATAGKRTWHTPNIVDSATTTYFYPQIAMNRAGQSVVVYEHFDNVAYSAWATMYDKETGWSTPLAIETGDAGHVYNPQVSIDDNGNAVAVWEQFNGSNYNVWANIYDAQNASWGIAEQIETSLTGGSEYYMPQVAMSQTGSAVVTWQKHDGLAISIWTSRYDMNTGWTQAKKLDTDDLYSAYLPKLSVDSAGNAAVVWEQFDSVSATYSTWGTHYNVTTGWTTASIISNVDSLSAYDAQIAVSDNGRAVAVWEQFDGTRFNVWTNVALNGVWGIAERVEYNTTGANEYYHPQVAMDKSGNAMVVWQQFDGQQLSAWANRNSNGVWETAQQIETNGISAITNPKVAMDEEGNAVAVWEQYDDSSKGSLISVWSNRYSASSGWESAQPLETNDTETMWFPEVSMDAYGNAQAVWFHNGLTEDNILVAENILQTNPPTANAGLDQAGFAARDIVTLDASASSDTDGTIAGYHWHQINGEEVSLDNKNTVTPSFSAPRITGELTFILTVIDNDGLTSSDTVVITVGDVSVDGLITYLLGNSGKIATHGLASGVMPEQWALNHGPKARKTKGKVKYSGRLESFSIDRAAQGYNGRAKPVKDIKDKN